MIQRITALAATFSLALLLAPGLAGAAHHEKGEGHDEANPCMAKEKGEKKGSDESGEKNPCMSEDEGEKKQ